MELFAPALKWLYAVDGSILFLLYLPQIRAVWRDSAGCKAISMTTWSFWTLSSVITAMYAFVVAHDMMFTLMSLANLTGCALVSGITLFRRINFTKRLRHQ